MSIKETERALFAARVIFYSAIFYMAVYAFIKTGV